MNTVPSAVLSTVPHLELFRLPPEAKLVAVLVNLCEAGVESCHDVAIG